MASYMRTAWIKWHKENSNNIPAVSPSFARGFNEGRNINKLTMLDKLKLIEDLLSSIRAKKEFCDELESDELIRLEAVIDLCAERHDEFEDMKYDERG